MNTESNSDISGKAPNLPEWQDCDLFCIHDYAGVANSSCGWRGRAQDARRDPADMRLLCPRCGCATLLRIPLDPANGANL
jgi:hypothetical protein